MAFFSRALKNAVFAVLAGFSMLAAAGCMRPQSRSVDSNNTEISKVGETADASFYLEEVTGSAVVAKSVSGFSIPSEKLYSFKTCIKDKRSRDSIKGHKFIVHGGSQKQSVRSDESGCLQWSETIAFSAMNDAKFLPLERFVEADGIHKGIRRLHIAINPWNFDGSEAVRDTERRPLPDSLLATRDEARALLNADPAAVSQSQRPLWIDELKINATHNPSGDAKSIDFNILLEPKVLLKNSRGETAPLVLTDGVFDAQFWMVARTESKQCLIIAKTEGLQSLTMVGGRLRDQVPIRLRYRNTYGQLELVARVAAKGTSASGTGLIPFEGVWKMGDHQSLIGAKSLTTLTGIAPSEPTHGGRATGFSSAQYLENCVDVADVAREESTAKLSALPSAPVGEVVPVVANRARGLIPPDLFTSECIKANDVVRLFPEDPEAQSIATATDLLSCENKDLPSGIARVEQFEFSHVEVRPEPIINPMATETATERTLKFRVTTQVTNPLGDNRALTNIKFKIEKADGTIEEGRTNSQGNLIFTDSIHHVYYKPERYMIRSVVIRHSSGFSRRLAIVFNPWDSERPITFARDIRSITKQTVAQVNLIPRPPSELMLTSFNWEALNYRYDVDRFLNLQIFKQYNIELNPRVRRYSSLTGGRMRIEPLRDGIYLLKWALQKNYVPVAGKTAEYVSGDRKLVRVEGGRIVVPIELMFRDFRVLKIRDNLAIELLAINEKKLTSEQRRTLRLNQSSKKELDALVESDSGLAARTFVGPVVPYDQRASGLIRPTDDLSELHCDTDCGDSKNGAKLSAAASDELSTYFGGLKHLAGVSVSKLLERKDWLESTFNTQQANRANLASYLSLNDLEYVPVINEKTILNQEPRLKENNRVLPAGSALTALMERMTSKSPLAQFGRVDQAQTYNALVKNPTERPSGFPETLLATGQLKADEAARLCLFFSEQMSLRLNAADLDSRPRLSELMIGEVRSKLFDLCLPEIVRSMTPGSGVLNGNAGFSVERFVRIFNVAETARLGGNLMALQIGASSGTSVGKTRSRAKTYSFNLFEVPRLIVGGISGLGASSMVFFDPFGFGYSVSSSESESQSESVDSSLGGGVSLAVETREMGIFADSYERCATVRYSPKQAARVLVVLGGALPQLRMNPTALKARANRGLMICDGALHAQRERFNEQYYQFSQSIGSEVINDPAALENHPYLVGVRGRSDFLRMVRALDAQPTKTYRLAGHEVIAEEPATRLAKTFQNADPAIPGFLRIDDHRVLSRTSPAK